MAEIKQVYMTRAYTEAINKKINEMFEVGELIAVEEEGETILTTPEEMERDE